MIRTIRDISRNNIGISGTDIGNVSSLTALLELGGENRNGDGGEDSDDRNDDQEFCEGKAFFVVLFQILFLL